MEVRLFTYGTLMKQDFIENLVGEYATVVSVIPSSIEGKMYTLEKLFYPIVILPEEGLGNRKPNVVYGALYTFDVKDEVMFWNTLDAYEGCSKSRMGVNAVNDLYKREIVKTKPIEFETIKSFLDFKFVVKEPVDTYVYLGNMDNRFVYDVCTHERRKNGVVWKTFLHIFHK